MEEQFTREQAIAFYDSGVWATWTPDQIVEFQLFQDCLCVPFDKFHESIEIVFGRPVFTHEFAFQDSLKAEYLKLKPAPTMEQILNLIPEEKRIVFELSPDENQPQSLDLDYPGQG